MKITTKKTPKNEFSFNPKTGELFSPKFSIAPDAIKKPLTALQASELINDIMERVINPKDDDHYLMVEVEVAPKDSASMTEGSYFNSFDIDPEEDGQDEFEYGITGSALSLDQLIIDAMKSSIMKKGCDQLPTLKTPKNYYHGWATMTLDTLQKYLKMDDIPEYTYYVDPETGNTVDKEDPKAHWIVGLEGRGEYLIKD